MEDDTDGDASAEPSPEELELDLDDETASEASVASLLPIDEAELDGEILIEEPPAEEKPRKKKKTVDPAALAAHRVWKRLRAERKAAKKAKRKAEARAKKRRGHGADLEAFLMKTKERLDTRATEAEAEAAAAIVVSARPLRSTGADLHSFILKTRERLADQAAAERAAQRAKEAKAAALAANADLETFRKECQARIAQKLLSKMPQVKAGDVMGEGAEGDACTFHRRKIAIVGAGPVGLWAAMLLAQKYRWTDSSGALRLRPDAPQIVVMEARSMASHCTRTDIRIALSSSTRSMLDQQTRSRAFSSGMPVAEIEENFLRRWRKVAGVEARIEYEAAVQDPKDLNGYDGILWSAGRRSLNEALRKDLGCEVRIGDSQKVIVFQVQELLAGDAWHLSSLDLSGAAQQAGRVPQLRVMLRPGFEGACACWLWVFGLPAELLESLVPKQASNEPRDHLVEAFEDLVGNDGGPLRAALEALQQRMKASGVTARVVDASFWSSDRAVCQLPSSVPLVLIGDALAGKPFYTGSTLNRHLWDVAKLVEEVEFAYDGGPLELSRFGSYERRYQDCVRRIGEFQRRAAAPVLPKPLPRMTSLTTLKRQDEGSPSLMKSLILPALARAAAAH